jgi:hypothetical protein
VSKRTGITCEDCYFRRAGLCALIVDVPCPTFRAQSRGALVPPRQARLVDRPHGRLAQTG